MKLKTISVLLAIAISASVSLAGAVPASASSFCYESGTLTTTPSAYRYSSITVRGTAHYRRLYNCSRVQIGIHVLSYSINYSGGWAGSGFKSSKHGLAAAGLDMYNSRVLYSAGESAYSGSVKTIGLSRSTAGSPNAYIYSGRFGRDRLSYTYADTAVYAYGIAPYSQYPQADNLNIWFNVQTGRWSQVTINGGASTR